VLTPFCRAVAAHDAAAALLLVTSELARLRADAGDVWLAEIGHYVYGGDTALHVAAAGHEARVDRALIAAGADVAARNRRGASPLHYAADGIPGSTRSGRTATVRHHAHSPPARPAAVAAARRRPGRSSAKSSICSELRTPPATPRKTYARGTITRAALVR
jgi:hypothetical protein